MSRNNSNPFCGRAPHRERTDDIVMNDAEGGGGYGTTSSYNPSSFSSSFSTHPTTSNPSMSSQQHPQRLETDWGTGDREWNSSEDIPQDPVPFHTTVRAPLQPQDTAFASGSQIRRQSSLPLRTTGEAPLNWTSNIFRDTLGNVTASELRARQQRTVGHEQQTPGRSELLA
jgi:hypothetical protein